MREAIPNRESASEEGEFEGMNLNESARGERWSCLR